MHHRLAIPLLTLTCALAPAANAAGKAGETANLSFHLETQNTQNPKLIFSQEVEGDTRYFNRMGEITTKDIVAFTPFPADDGSSYGIVFQLRDPARRRLAAVSSANQGKWMVSQVNGRIVDGVIIDKAVDDGFIVIWEGVNLADIEQYDKAVPRIGAKKPKR